MKEVKETEILLRSIMLDLLVAEDLEEAQNKISIMLDEDQLTLVQKKAEQIKAKKNKSNK
ncbi:MAG: hypothetical protein H9W82_03320 [Lactobacillus sp.]|nr:hypothetical protein [Lactobacillus sp.]